MTFLYITLSEKHPTSCKCSKKGYNLCAAWMPPSAPGPRGNQSRRFPPSDKPTGPPSAEDVTRMIALIWVEKWGTGSPPSGAHGGGWGDLGKDGGEPAAL